MVPKIKPPMSGDPSLYHMGPKGFWKKLGKRMSVTDEVSGGVPIADLNRTPAPGSRPEEYAVVATQASDVAFNPYWKRDTRRAYPVTSVITQNHLTNLLLASPEGKAIAPPPQDSESTDLTTVAGPTYSAVLEQLHPSKSIYSFEDKRLPPSPPPPVRGGRVLKETEKVQFANPEMNMELYG